MSDVASKWGDAVAGRGFAQVPNYLLILNQFLEEEKRLSPTELLILIQLVGTWWDKDVMPFPSLKTLAARSGISDRQAQRAVSRLESVNLLKRVKRKDGSLIASNAYDLSPLVEFLGEVSKAFPNQFVRKKRPKIKLKMPENQEEAKPVSAIKRLSRRPGGIKL